MRQLFVVSLCTAIGATAACSRSELAPVVLNSALAPWQSATPVNTQKAVATSAPQPAFHPLRLYPNRREATILPIPQRQSKQAVKVATATGRVHHVRAGDTLHGLSGRYGVTLRTLIDANKLQPPFDLFVGQNLLVPEPRYHYVRAGNTVYGVSRHYDVDMATLVRENAIQPPYELLPGQRLLIPWSAKQAESEVSVDPKGIANKLATAARVMPVNVARRAAPAKNRYAAPGRAPRPSVKPGMPNKAHAPRRRYAGLPSPELKPYIRHAKRTPSENPRKTPPPRASRTFAWPVEGPLLSRFGPKKGGQHNDGINVGAPFGTAVKAAENGVVAYVGNELKSYGNLILIRHANGWTSAYAHLGVIQVAPGTVVNRGQTIGTVGASGAVLEPQLHFELRKGKAAVNPIRYMAPATQLALNGDH